MLRQLIDVVFWRALMLPLDFVRAQSLLFDNFNDRLLVHLHAMLIVRLKWTATLIVKVTRVHVVRCRGAPS